MKYISGLTLPLLLLLPFACNQKEYPAAVNSLIPNKTIDTAQIDTISVYASNFPNGTEISVCIIRDSIPGYIGFSRVNDTLIPVRNEEVLFEIGSISKVFTSTLLVSILSEGGIRLDQLVSDFFDFDFADSALATVTFKQLANHTSGLPRLPTDLMTSLELRSDDPYSKYGPERLETQLKEKIKSYTDPGSAYEYSNLGAGLLSYTLARAQDISYESMLQEKIFSKYGMISSTTQISNVQNRLAGALDKNGKPTSNWDLNVFVGAGGIMSSTKDLSLFVRANFSEDSILRFQQQETFEINPQLAVALGWHISKYETDQYHWHNGGTGGYTSMCIFNNRTRNAVIVLSNVSAFNVNSRNIDHLANALMKSIEKVSLLQ